MLKLSTAIFICFLACNISFAQYYLRGEVRDEKGRILSGVKINLLSKGNYSFFTGDNGTFGLPCPRSTDSITLTFEGYETFRKVVPTQEFQKLVMKMLPATARAMKNKLASITKNLTGTGSANFFPPTGESYTSLIENTFVDASGYPETGFALNIDRASYSNIRRFLNNELNVPMNAVRIEEMLNYFNFNASKKDSADKKFSATTAVTNCPWNKETNLVFVNLLAPKLNLDSVPPSNLVFLIDISGSMDKPNRLPLLQSAFKLLTQNLRAIDTLSIVTYGGGVAIQLAPTSGIEKDKINRVIDSLSASGDTPGEGAIRIAYAVAKKAFIRNGNNRVIIATDGDFNVGQTSEKQLEEMIVVQRESGIYLTCLGVGMGNYKDSKLETLAKKGNGNFAYLDNIQEAEKVLVTEFTKTLYNVVNDAFVSISFDAQKVKEYRLIGFDNKTDAIADISSEIEGGEVGSGHSLMAIFEVQLKPDVKDNIATVNLQYKPVKTDVVVKQSFPVNYQLQDLMKADSSIRFATAVSMFGALLKHSPFAKKYTFSDVIKLGATAVTEGNFAQREFLELVYKADRIYNPRKKR